MYVFFFLILDLTEREIGPDNSCCLFLFGSLKFGKHPENVLKKKCVKYVFYLSDNVKKYFDTLYDASADMRDVLRKQVLHSIWINRHNVRDIVKIPISRPLVLKMKQIGI